MDRVPPEGRETVRALFDLTYLHVPVFVQKPTVDGGYVLRKPDHGIIIIQEEKPKSGCAYDEYDDSILENVRFVVHCRARIGVESAECCAECDCGGLINDYDFIFAVTDYEKFLNLVKSGREDFDWLIYNTYVDARTDDWPLSKTPYPAAIDFNKLELVIGDRILNPGPVLKEYCENQRGYYEDCEEELERFAAARERHARAGPRQFQGTFEDLLSHPFRLF